MLKSAICMIFTTVLACVAIGCADADPNGGTGFGNNPNADATANSTVIIFPGAYSKGTAAFGTNPLIVKVGTAVTWINKDTVNHNITSVGDLWRPTFLQPGQSFSFQFNSVGDFSYYCSIYGQSSMSGTVRVSQ